MSELSDKEMKRALSTWRPPEAATPPSEPGATPRQTDEGYALEYCRALKEYAGSDESMFNCGFAYGVIVGKRSLARVTKELDELKQENEIYVQAIEADGRVIQAVTKERDERFTEDQMLEYAQYYKRMAVTRQNADLPMQWRAARKGKDGAR